jgi:hypothetical protein
VEKGGVEVEVREEARIEGVRTVDAEEEKGGGRGGEREGEREEEREGNGRVGPAPL